MTRTLHRPLTGPVLEGKTMADAPLQLAVIVGSTREGRLGSTVAEWLVTRARQRDEVALDVIDLIDFDLPMVYPQEPEPAAQAYIDRIDRADAFVVITPEYNHGYPASLKQAIDLPRDQWRRKPVAFVSYGGAAGGLRAVEQLRQVFAELHAVTIRDSVSFHMAWDRFDESGEPHEPIRCNADAETMLDELAWWATALRTARAADTGDRRPSSRRVPPSSPSSRSGQPAASTSPV